jgi:hypothetical protein
LTFMPPLMPLVPVLRESAPAALRGRRPIVAGLSKVARLSPARGIFMRVSAAPVPALFNKIAGDAGNGIKWMLQSSGNDGYSEPA